MYIIRRGQVAVLAADPAGAERRLAVLEEGDHFGEIALLHDAPRMGTIRARTAVELQVLDKEDFAALLAAEPESRATMERIMAEREQRPPVPQAPRAITNSGFRCSARVANQALSPRQLHRCGGVAMVDGSEEADKDRVAQRREVVAR
jgi:CRP-like cAMP-binding protein